MIKPINVISLLCRHVVFVADLFHNKTIKVTATKNERRTYFTSSQLKGIGNKVINKKKSASFPKYSYRLMAPSKKNNSLKIRSLQRFFNHVTYKGFNQHMCILEKFSFLSHMLYLNI